MLSTACNMQGPCSRNVFTLCRVEAQDVFGADDIVRYGQKVRLQSNCHLYKKKLAVGSMPHGPAAHAALSHNQEASMHPHQSYNNVWVIDSLDPNDRFER